MNHTRTKLILEDCVPWRTPPVRGDFLRVDREAPSPSDGLHLAPLGD
ncbi:MAG: hypothetical protein BMS9Abin29_2239 [Gemmatimonadota bacterium]|nr:MAG: hypothetical protein BMS9Abin29_2239 [Gemmatimonadota bacterium]